MIKRVAALFAAVVLLTGCGSSSENETASPEVSQAPSAPEVQDYPNRPEGLGGVVSQCDGDHPVTVVGVVEPPATPGTKAKYFNASGAEIRESSTTLRLQNEEFRVTLLALGDAVVCAIYAKIDGTWQEQKPEPNVIYNRPSWGDRPVNIQGVYALVSDPLVNAPGENLEG